MLAQAIEAVASAHGLVPGESPSSTVALARWNETDVECLVLGDSSIVVSHVSGAVEHLTDDRLAAVATAERQTYRRRLAAGHGYDEEHRTLLARRCSESNAHARNVEGGYWIAEANAEAAFRALYRRYQQIDVSQLILMSDGTANAVHPLGLLDWTEMPHELETKGCPLFLSYVSEAEDKDPYGHAHPRSKRHDDKTVILASGFCPRESEMLGSNAAKEAAV